ATTMVEALISTPPTAGRSVTPAQARAPAASGLATTLYPVARARFWIIFRKLAADSRMRDTTGRGPATAWPTRRHHPRHVPWGTFWINVSGSFAVGFVLLSILERFRPTRWTAPHQRLRRLATTRPAAARAVEPFAPLSPSSRLPHEAARRRQP